ncbi:MAG TPA: glycosyltransferase family 4 protein [Candidatus Binataceae bacterium]|nr:glycosyltransferase family 4 protein [Candidatus Binataceae bacterium]
MRIALLTRRFDPLGGGTERDLIVTAQCLRDAGHDLTIFAREVRGQSQNLNDFKIRRFGGTSFGRTMGLLSFAYGAPKAARLDGADLIISFARTIDADVLRSGGSAHISYLRAARKWRGELRWRAMRASPYHQAQVFIERRGFTSSKLKAAIAVSNLVRDDLIREFRLPQNKVVTLYNGVDLERFTPARDDSGRREIRSSIGIADAAPIVAFVGNGFARKGLRFLIEAWPRVTRGAHLLVVGADRESRQYQREAARLAMSTRIHFAGQMSNITRIFQGVDALAMPSIFEPFGNVGMEAMASGLPVMVSAQSGASELLPETMQKFVVQDPCDSIEIAEKLNALLDTGETLRDAARAAAERYTWNAYGENLMKIISALPNNR